MVGHPFQQIEKDKETGRRGDKEASLNCRTPCLLVSKSPCLIISVADVRQQGHEAGALDGAGNGVLAGGVATGLATADDAAVTVGQLRKQVEVFVVDVHRTRGLAINVDGVALRGPLDVALALVLVAAAGTFTGGIRHDQSSPIDFEGL